MAVKIVDQQADVTAHTGGTLSLPTIEIVARSAHEYRTMFGLDADGRLKQLLQTQGAAILDCPGSASSFGFQVRRMADRAGSDLTVVSADIVYDHTPREIYDAAVATVHRLLDPLIADGNSWRNATWLSEETPFATPRDLLEHRLAIYAAYFGDAEKNKDCFVATALPDLSSLRGRKFDLIVSGNLLFAYADKHFGESSEERLDFHIKSILNFGELLKDGGELRIYPIGTASTKVYPHMETLMSKLEKAGYELSIRKVDAMLKADWDQMAVITRRPSVSYIV
jgi:hypothetical protein